MKMEINAGGGGINIDGVVEQAKARGVITAGDFVKLVTQINAKQDMQLSSTQYSGYQMSAVALDENRVLVIHSEYNTDQMLYAVVYTINEITITKRN